MMSQERGTLYGVLSTPSTPCTPSRPGTPDLETRVSSQVKTPPHGGNVNQQYPPNNATYSSTSKRTPQTPQKNVSGGIQREAPNF